MDNGYFMVTGENMEDLLVGVEAMKKAVASGAPCGCGGSSIEEIENGLSAIIGQTETDEECMSQMVDEWEEDETEEELTEEQKADRELIRQMVGIFGGRKPMNSWDDDDEE